MQMPRQMASLPAAKAGGQTTSSDSWPILTNALPRDGECTGCTCRVQLARGERGYTPPNAFGGARTGIGTRGSKITNSWDNRKICYGS